ncbi:hypothetical protein [Blastococcus sp. TF02A-26]|uniref:hypothetical protein n=1 Tax=Blastococcus sp. TF02A-26 TaxID=2250577 RepID=UPI0011BEA77A|nr:hypothetical protein [Blastococcus sp. TF02A-26]
MTSGQGGPDQQGWQQPPQGHPGQQPAYGQQPPYGQQPYGYAPAPSAGWGGPPPEPMERPQTVRIGIGAFVATLLLGLISSIVQLSDTDDFVEQIMDADPSITRDTAEAALTVGIVIGLLVVGLQALFIWFAWTGRNWARIVLFVLGGLGVFSGLVGLAGSGATNVSGFLTSLGVFSLLLTIVGIVALALKPSSEWYRHEGWRRSAMR